MLIPDRRSFQLGAVYCIVGNLRSKDLYNHTVKLSGPYVPLTFVNWCKSNIENPCAYWFDLEAAYLGFNDKVEATWFALCNNLGEYRYG